MIPVSPSDNNNSSGSASDDGNKETSSSACDNVNRGAVDSSAPSANCSKPVTGGENATDGASVTNRHHMVVFSYASEPDIAEETETAD